MGARSIRALIHEQLEPQPDGRLHPVSGAIVTLVLVSFVTLALETEATRGDSPMSRDFGALMSLVNTLIVYVFAAEFLVRFWAEGENPQHAGPGGRLRYLLSPLAIADLLAFLPELIVMSLPDTQSGPWLVALRGFRLFRLFKLARYVPAFGIVGGAVRRAGAPLLAALCVAAAQVYIAALLLYFIEGDSKPEQFGSIPRALWWAIVTLTTVGYGDVYPESILGRVAAGLVALAGIGIVAMPTGILASAFADEFRERSDAKERALRERLAAPEARVEHAAE